MVKQSILQGILGKSKILVGILLMSVLIGAGGCSPSKATTAQDTSQDQTNQGQITPGQPGRGQRVRNPAEQAAMEIRRLQSNQQNALNSEQKEKIKPILEELIKTSNPSQDVLQQKADAINAVLTEQQKSYLTTQRTPNGNNSTGNSTKENNPQGGTGTGGKQNGGAFNLQDIYQQVLDSLK